MTFTPNRSQFFRAVFMMAVTIFLSGILRAEEVRLKVSFPEKIELGQNFTAAVELHDKNDDLVREKRALQMDVISGDEKNTIKFDLMNGKADVSLVISQAGPTLLITSDPQNELLLEYSSLTVSPKPDIPTGAQK